jgi:uncharacterized protein (DUF2252 family)
MQGFYPAQSKDFLEKRIAANKDFHSFYRAFVPFYYDIINEDQEIKNTFLQLSKFKAAIGGDAHVENFGFVMTSAGSARLVLNDVDDASLAPVYMDVMRLYISGKIVTDDLHWVNFLAAYQSGLKGEDHVFSDYVKRNKQNAPTEIKKFLDEYISSEQPIKFIKFKKPMYVLDEPTKNEIKESLKKTNSQIKIYDDYLRVKEDGGSAGITRYEVLAQVVPGEEPVWLDIKEMTVSSYDKVFKKDVPTFSQRMSLIKNSLYEEDISSHISMIKIGNKDFSVRTMNQFGLGVKIEDISHLELADTVLDEAYALGQIHARSLQKNSLKVDDYSQAWEKIPNDNVKSASKKIRDALEKKYTSKI